MLTLLRGGTLLDGTGAQPVPEGAVLLETNQIRYAGPAAGLELRGSDVEVVDTRGQTMLPGLFNVHAHMTFDPGFIQRPAPYRPIEETSETLAAYARLRDCLEHGVTTVREMSAGHFGVIKLRNLINSGMLTGPRVVSCGRSLTMTGGHSKAGIQIDGPEAALKAARRVFKAGADFLKLIHEAGTSEGAIDLRSPELAPEELTAAIGVAKRLRKPTAVHAITPGPVKEAVLAGIDSVEHGYAIDDECLRLMVERGTYLVPTYQLHELILRNRARFPYPSLSYFQRTSEIVRESLARAIKAGVKIAVGTDGGTAFNPAHEVVVEIQGLVEHGMTPLQAIRAATHNSAEVCGLLDRVGTLEEGKLGDLLVVDGDPLADLENLRRIRLVYKDGACLVRR